MDLNMKCPKCGGEKVQLSNEEQKDMVACIQFFLEHIIFAGF